MKLDRLIIARRGPFAVHAPADSHVFGIAPPGRGKTETVICNGLLWRGPALIASSKGDVMKATAAVRVQQGHSVWVLDLRPQRHQLPDGCKRALWTPLRGCADFSTSMRRSAALTSAVRGGQNGDFWGGKAGELLGPLLNAGALAKRPLSEVIEWLRTASFDFPLAVLNKNGATEASTMLTGVAGAGREHFGSVQSTASLAVAIFSGPRLEDADAGLGPDGFDPAQLSRQGTLFVISPSDNAGSDGGPVACAIADEIYAARKSDHDHGVDYDRMCWLIDEAALLPLKGMPAILAEGRGFGLRILCCTQSWGAVRERWGDRGADTIRDAAATSVLWGGLHDDALLSTYEKLGGQHWMRHEGAKEQSQGQWQPRWSAHRIAHLPQRKVLIFNGINKPRLLHAAFARKMWVCQHVLEQTKTTAEQLRLMRLRMVLVIVVSILVLILAHILPLSQLLHQHFR
jgi:type IV secretion system protein VirD4